MKALFVNGSPRKNWSTAKMLGKAMEGAASAGAETELVHLYDDAVNPHPTKVGCFQRPI